MRHGEGTIRYDNGGVYEGPWKGGARQGKGREIFVSGAKYTGEFFGGLMNGFGVFDVPPVGSKSFDAYVRTLLIYCASAHVTRLLHKCARHSSDQHSRWTFVRAITNSLIINHLQHSSCMHACFTRLC